MEWEVVELRRDLMFVEMVSAESGAARAVLRKHDRRLEVSMRLNMFDAIVIPAPKGMGDIRAFYVQGGPARVSKRL